MGERASSTETSEEKESSEKFIDGSNMSVAVIEAHKVKTGETLDSIAQSYGYSADDLARFNWGTSEPEEITMHLRDNVGCKKKTADGKNYMFDNMDDPGIIYIPRQWKMAGLNTERTNIFRVKPHMFPSEKYVWIEVHYTLGLYESEPFELEVNGKIIKGNTTTDGVIEASVPKDAIDGKLKIGGLMYDLKLIDDELEDTLEAAQIRLNNLGFDCGPVSGTWDDHSKMAMRLFQARFNLPPTGEADKNSLELLKKVHDFKDNPADETPPEIEEGDPFISEDIVPEEELISESPEDNPSYFV